MPSPTTSLATLRPDLGMSMEEFDVVADRLGFIGHRVLPVTEVSVQADTFGRIPIEELLREANLKRASKGGYSRSDFRFVEDTFATQEYGMEQVVDDRNARMYGNYFNAELIAAKLARDKVLRGREKRIADVVFNATVWTGASLTTAVANEWDDAVNAKPIDDIKNACFKVYDNCGLWPSAVIFNRKVFKNLRLTGQIQDAIASNGAGESVVQGKITVDQIAQAFDLPHVLVAGGTRNTARHGQNATLSTIWSNEYAMVCVIAETDAIEEPCIGRTFHWGMDGSQIGGAFETYRDETIRADIARARQEVDEKILYVETGHLLSNITT